MHAYRKFQKDNEKVRLRLRECLNLQDKDSLPAVRPEVLGYAFVRYVLQTVFEPTEKLHPDNVAAFNVERQTNQLDLVQGAWGLHPYGVRTALGRVGAVTDDLGRAIRVGPPEGVDVDPVDLAKAYCKAAVQHSFGQPLPSDGCDAVLHVAIERLRALLPSQADETLSYLSGLMEVLGPFAYPREEIGFACYVEALARATEDGSLLPQSIIKMTDRLQAVFSALRLTDYENRAHHYYYADSAISTAIVALERLAVCADVLVSDNGSVVDDLEPIRCVAELWQHICGLQSLLGHEGGCVKARQRVVEIAEPHRSDRQFALQLALAEGHVCFLYRGFCLIDERKCLAACSKAVRWAGSHALERDFALAIARAEGQICSLYRCQSFYDEEKSLTALDKVMKLAGSFSGDKDFALVVLLANESQSFIYRDH